MNVLLAEDNAYLRESLSALLELWGIEYDLATTGYEALKLARQNHGDYDLGLLDVDMPVMSGKEATRAIRKETSFFPFLAKFRMKKAVWKQEWTNLS